MPVSPIMCSNNINNNSNISFKAKAKVSILLNPQTALSRVNNISKAPYQTILPFAPVTKFLFVLTPIALASKSCKQYTDTFIGMAEQYIERVFTDKNVQCKPVIAKHGVCDNVEDFYKEVEDYLGKIEGLVPPALYDKLSTAVKNKQYSNLKNVVKEYYSGLNDCQTIENVKAMYPEMMIEVKQPKEIALQEFESVIAKSEICKIKKLPIEQQEAALSEYIYSRIPKVVDKEDFAALKSVADAVKQKILNGKFEGYNIPNQSHWINYNAYRPAAYFKFLSADFDKAFIETLKQNYIEMKPWSTIEVQLENGKISKAKVDYNKKHSAIGTFRELNYSVISGLSNIELQAVKFKDKFKDSTKFQSEIMSNVWRTSRLKADFGTEAYKDKYQISKILTKQKYPDTSMYSTDNLVEAYIYNRYIQGLSANLDQLNKTANSGDADKIKKFVKALYRTCNLMMNDDKMKNTINSPEYKNFRAQFNTDSLKEVFESLEDSYVKIFFHAFWTDTRVERFTNAFHKCHDAASRNVELIQQMTERPSEEIKMTLENISPDEFAEAVATEKG